MRLKFSGLTVEKVSIPVIEATLSLKQSIFWNVWFQKISRLPPQRELEIPGGWGGQRPRKFQKGGGLDHKITFQGVNVISFSTWVPTLLLTDLVYHFWDTNNLELYHLRLFLLILTRFPFFQKGFECNFKGIWLTTARFITCSYVRPPLLVTSLPQVINACNTSRCVGRSIEEQ